MALFEFELDPVEEIRPWRSPDGPYLTWFALTWGVFRMPVGSEVLFRYTDDILSHWHRQAADFAAPATKDVDYQLASLARDVLNCVMPAVAPLSPLAARIAEDRDLLEALTEVSVNDEGLLGDLGLASRWLGERSPCTSYFVEAPRIHFLRLGDEVLVRWDNRSRLIDGIPVWTAAYGEQRLSVAAFLDEARDFANRLLATMATRLDAIDAGKARPQVTVDSASLRKQQVTWQQEFERYFEPRRPDISWAETDAALRAVARERGIGL